MILDTKGNVFIDERLHAFVVNLLFHPTKQFRRANNQPRLDEGRLRLHILVGLLHAILHAPHGVPDLQPQIPKHVEHRIGDALQIFMRLGATPQLVITQELNVDIALRIQLLPAITTDGNHRHGRRRF